MRSLLQAGENRASDKVRRRTKKLWDATVEVIELEPRLLFCADGDELIGSPAYVGGSPSHLHHLHHASHAHHLAHLHAIAVNPSTNNGPGAGAPGSPLSDVPALNSDPDATASLYLDFSGAAAQAWGSYNVPATPAYDQDGDVTTFSDSELASIREIWARVAESYSPFNINVTTVDPGNLSDGLTSKVVVGGSGAWLGPAGGVSYVGSFSNPAPNVEWVFPGELGNGNPKYTADAIAHEAGHSFGLNHQSSYSGTKKTAEYRGDSGGVAPIMGVSYYSTRGKWSNGQSSLGYSIYQDDMAVIASNTNGFGYRADDHGDTIGAADALDVSDANVSGSGIINSTSDVDAFSFVTSAGTVNFSVNVAQYGAMLDATLKLVDLNGTVIASSDTSSLSESLTASVGAGSYRLMVSSKGVYGDVGQYTVSGTIVPSPNYVAPPSNLTATPSGGNVNLNWYDNAWNETHYAIERSDDGGTTWNPLDLTDANGHGYVDSTVAVSQTYQYRVYAYNDTDQSIDSSVATVAVTPATPGSFTATSISATEVDLSWSDVSGETGYILERSHDNATWSQIATPASDATSYSDTGVIAGNKYYYRLRSISGVGASANTTIVNATTRTTQPSLSVTVLSSAQINLAWTNVVGETGYRIERSLNGSDWTVLGTTAANIVSYANLGLIAGTAYFYRVVGVDAGGDSAAGMGTATTPLAAPTGLTATGVGTTEIDLTWANSSGETGYRLERSLDEKTWTALATLAADVTSYANTGLIGGTRYVYRLRALNAGGASVQSASASTFTIPLATTLTATVASTTQINLSWNNVAGETNYILQRSDNGTDGWTTIASPLANVLSYGNTGLTADTPYFYRVVAHNASGDSTASAVVSTRTLLPAASGLTATAASTSEIDLAWSDSTGETGYRIERSLDEKTWTILTTVAADTTTYSNTGLSGGTRYIYRVRAMNAGGAALPSLSASTYTVPLVPTLTATVASDTLINLAWSNVAGETNYVVQRSDNGTDGWATIASPLANVIAYANTGLTADTDYFYRVLAHNGSGDSATSLVVTKHTLLPAVTGLAATGISTTEVDLAWDDSTGESGYRIERSLNKVTWTLLTTTAADVLAYANTALVAGTAYYYRVHALNAGGASLTPQMATGTTLPAGTTLTATTVSGSQIRLNWVNIAGESGYHIERSPDGSSDWTLIATAAVNAVTYTDTALTNDTPYYYRVTAYNTSGSGATSAVMTARTQLAAPTGLTATASSTTQVNLTWDDSTGESGYVIERSLNGGTAWATLTSVAAGVTSYSNTGLTAGTVYAYRIRAVNAGGNSEPSIKAMTTTIPAAVTITATAISPTQINLSWTNIAGETGYRVESSPDGSTWSVLTTTAANVVTYANAGLVTDTPHSYRVTPFNASGDGASTAITRRTLLTPPTGLIATAASTTSISLSWSDSTGETAYKIERWTGKVWALLTTVSADVTSYLNTGLVAKSTYIYRLRATNAGGDSAPSATAQAVTPAAGPVPKHSTATAFQTQRLIG
jgi:hypothetical protein